MIFKDFYSLQIVYKANKVHLLALNLGALRRPNFGWQKFGEKLGQNVSIAGAFHGRSLLYGLFTEN